MNAKAEVDRTSRASTGIPSRHPKALKTQRSESAAARVLLCLPDAMFVPLRRGIPTLIYEFHYLQVFAQVARAEDCMS